MQSTYNQRMTRVYQAASLTGRGVNDYFNMPPHTESLNLLLYLTHSNYGEALF
jgi:hypothetical protein